MWETLRVNLKKLISRVNALILTPLIKIHEISPGAIQKSNGLKVTCLMSLYFKSEEDTMKNYFSEIFVAPPFEEIYLPNVLKSSTSYLVIIETPA